MLGCRKESQEAWGQEKHPRGNIYLSLGEWIKASRLEKWCVRSVFKLALFYSIFTCILWKT